MTSKQIQHLQQISRERLTDSPPQGNPPLFRGHSHFWKRAMSRRNFAGTAAAVAGLAAGARLALAPRALAAGSPDPRPIPGGIQPFGPGTPVFHVFIIGSGEEPSTITDFNGVSGVAQVDGTWSGGGVVPPPGVPLVFDTDMRFMSGEYIGLDGTHHNGGFVFV
jgi:hypothetical protein